MDNVNVNANDNLIQSLKEVFKETISPLENKIDNMQEDVNVMKIQIEHLESNVDNVKYEVKNMQMYLSGVDYDIREIKLNIENHIKPGIQMLVEGHQSSVKNIKDLEENQDDIGSTVLALDIMHTHK